MKQPYKEVFNDGYIQYGYKKTQRSSSGKRTGEIFTPEGKLAYKELSAREGDYQLAGAMNAKLDLKVKTLYPASFKSIKKSNLIVLLNGIEFEVIKVDSDNSNQFLYFYLQEVGVTNE